MAQQGYLVATAIKGYSAFLSQSELEHASDILQNLFATLLENLKPPLILAMVQGESVLAHLPGKVQPQTLIEMVENLYCAFVRHRDLMHANTTCTCTACRLLPTLELRCVVHHGEYMRSSFQDQEQLSGAAVLLTRALMEQHLSQVAEAPYALFTLACPLGAAAQNMTVSIEPYADFGEIQLYNHNLMPAWEHFRAQQRCIVTPEQAWYRYEMLLPVPPPQAWEYVNLPEYQQLWRNANTVSITELQAGRMGEGSTIHCAHGTTNIIGTIIDWQPFEYVTVRFSGMMNSDTLMTVRLAPVEAGTQLDILVAKPTFKTSLTHLLGQPFVPLMKTFLRRNTQTGKAALLAVVETNPK